MNLAYLHELGPRVMRELRLENEGKAEWRVVAIILRHYDQYSPSRSS